jgi:hypothetical protein
VAGVQSGGRLHGRARTGGARRSGGAADGSSIFFVHRFKSKVGNKLTKNSIKVRIMMHLIAFARICTVCKFQILNINICLCIDPLESHAPDRTTYRVPTS